MDEIRNSNGRLKPDVYWYLRNQLLPTLSRLVAPLHDCSQEYLCSCLGLEYKAVEADATYGDADYSCSFVPRLQRKDYNVLYAGADPLLIKCDLCGNQYSFKGSLHSDDSSVGFVCRVGLFDNADC